MMPSQITTALFYLEPVYERQGGKADWHAALLLPQARGPVIKEEWVIGIAGQGVATLKVDPRVRQEEANNPPDHVRRRKLCTCNIGSISYNVYARTDAVR